MVSYHINVSSTCSLYTCRSSPSTSQSLTCAMWAFFFFQNIFSKKKLAQNNIILSQVRKQKNWLWFCVECLEEPSPMKQHMLSWLHRKAANNWDISESVRKDEFNILKIGQKEEIKLSTKLLLLLQSSSRYMVGNIFWRAMQFLIFFLRASLFYGILLL